MGDRLVVGLRTLTPSAGVRIPLPQPKTKRPASSGLFRGWGRGVRTPAIDNRFDPSVARTMLQQPREARQAPTGAPSIPLPLSPSPPLPFFPSSPFPFPLSPFPLQHKKSDLLSPEFPYLHTEHANFSERCVKIRAHGNDGFRKTAACDCGSIGLHSGQ